MLALIQAIHKELNGAYGSPRMVRELRSRGFPASKTRVERIMRDHGIRARHKRRYKATTDSRHSLPIAENLLGRNFAPTAPNQAWCGDITYIRTEEGWLYLAVVIDLFNREVIGWSIKPRMTADIVCDALTMAWFRRRPDTGLIYHSDRGSQYAREVFQAKLREYGMVCSMSRKGNCWDNAPAESFFNSMKNERVHGTRYSTREEAIADLFDYIEVFYATQHGKKRSLICSTTSKCSTTGVVVTPRSATTRRLSSLRTGSGVSMRGKWRLDAMPLEDEK